MKRAMSMMINSLFAIFLVIIAVMVLFMVTGARKETLEARQSYDTYLDTNSLFITVLGNPDCFSYGEYGNSSWQAPIQGVLSKEKMDRYNLRNIDPPCLKNYDYLYSLYVEDLDTGRNWSLGMQDFDENLSEKTFQAPMYVSIYNTPYNITFAMARFRIYTGPMPSFYGRVKQMCMLRADGEYMAGLDYDASYHGGEFCMKGFCFVPDFACRVKEFSIGKGEHLIYFKYRNDELEILT